MLQQNALEGLEIEYLMQLKDYVKKARDSGLTDEEIKERLIFVGTDQKFIDLLELHIVQGTPQHEEDSERYSPLLKHRHSPEKAKLPFEEEEPTESAMSKTVTESAVTGLKAPPQSDVPLVDHPTYSATPTPSASMPDLPPLETKPAQDPEELKREEDVIRPEEFAALEKKESHSLLTAILPTKNHEQAADKKEDPIEDMTPHQLTVQIAKLQKMIDDENVANGKQDGKMDVLSDKSDKISEKIADVEEKIGELRSTVLGRERMFNKLEDDFASVKYIVNTFKPENVDKRFEEVTKHFLKSDSEFEKLTLQIKAIEDKLTNYSRIMDSIQSYSMVIEKLDALKEVSDKIEKMKLDIERTSSKSEIMFQNMRDAIGKIESAHTLSKHNESAIQDITIALTKVESQQDFFVKKEDFDEIKGELDVVKKTMFDEEFATVKR